MKFYRIVLAAMFSAYTAAWSYISLLRFYSLNAFVLDLGVSMQFAWYAAENLGAFLYVLAYKGIVYFLLPLFLTKNYPAVLVFQSAFIGLAVFPLFGIARHYLHDDVSALLISASYLVYFPLAGVNWFDFHYQALFPTLFLLGYYFYVKGRYGISLAFMMISALTHYPYTVFPLMFALMSLFYKNRKTWYSLSLMAFTGFIFALNFALLGFYGATVGAYGIAGAGTAAPFATDALTMILLLLPLLFLPLLSKWSIFLLPFIALIAITNYSIYRYPLLFMYQYPALFAAFVFLGAIDAIRLFRGRERAISALLIISVSAFAIAYEPYSPLNQATSLNYSILGYSMQSMSINWQRYNGLIKVLSLIPPGASVLAQNNMPEIYPSNDTVYDSSFDNAVNRSVRYVVADPLSFSYNQGPGMGSQFAELWGSGNYGLLAEADGIILLERNYSGSIEYYQPLSMNYTAKQLSITGYAKLVNGTIEASNVSNEKLWYGPWTSVVPGLYMITFYLRGYNMNGGRVELLATANDWGTVLGSDVLNGSGIGPEWAPFQFYFYANSVYQQVELIGYAKGLSGELFMKNVSITQVGPGLPNSHDYYVFPDQLSTRGALRNYEITVSNASNEIAWYGPYLTLQPGHYIVRYELST
nr:DUF2079 domain-containing protein [Nitrososphaerota archaeon]